MATQNQFRKSQVLSGVLLAFLAWPFMASAQLQKCTDPVTGKITFSDRGCSSGEEMTSIRVAPANSSDSSQYRNHQPVYSQPEISQQQSGPRVTVVGDSGRQDSERKRLCREASTPHKGAPGLTASQLAVAAKLCTGVDAPMPESVTTQPRSMPAPASLPAAPAQLTHCDATGCWDTNGARYNRGAGATHIPATGGPACQLVGGQMICP